MLEQFLKSRSLIDRYKSGPYSVLLDGFARDIHDSGYSTSQGARHL